jgi:hypothetical protein
MVAGAGLEPATSGNLVRSSAFAAQLDSSLAAREGSPLPYVVWSNVHTFLVRAILPTPMKEQRWR